MNENCMHSSLSAFIGNLRRKKQIKAKRKN